MAKAESMDGVHSMRIDESMTSDPNASLVTSRVWTTWAGPVRIYAADRKPARLRSRSLDPALLGRVVLERNFAAHA